jgi:hypothetical protein
MRADDCHHRFVGTTPIADTQGAPRQPYSLDAVPPSSTPATDEPSIRETSPGRLSENGILGGESDRESGRKVAVNTNLMVRRSYSSGMLEEGWPLA